MKITTIKFNGGIQFPAKLGTVVLKPTSENKASYSQNIDVANDEYGMGAVTPSPALATIGSNSELTGVPVVRQAYNNGSTPLGYVYFGQGLLGTKTVIRRIKDVLTGSTPAIDTTGSMTVNHSSHTNQEIVDMVLRPTSSGTDELYVTGKDDTDTWVYKFTASDSSPSLSLVTTNANFTGGYTSQFFVLSSFDNNIYWIGKGRVSSISTADAINVTALSLGLPVGSHATCGVDWQQQLLVAYTAGSLTNFSQRKSNGGAGVVIWDYVSPAITRNVPAPCRYISVLINAPDGTLICFGGVDEGRSSIYAFTGFGFRLLTQYIGDLPRSRHNVEFDGQGRIVWQTVEGQICRYDIGSGTFEHLGSITTGSSAGGILAKGIGSPTGNDFFAASGTGSTYTLKTVQFGAYLGDGAAGSDGITTPLTISGTQVLAKGATIKAITINLSTVLKTSEALEIRIYANGSTTPTVYGTMTFAADGAVASKRIVYTLPNINTYNLGIAWKQTDALTTAPAVISAVIETEGIY